MCVLLVVNVFPAMGIVTTWLASVGWPHATVEGVTRLFGPSGTPFDCCLLTVTVVAGAVGGVGV